MTEYYTYQQKEIAPTVQSQRDNDGTSIGWILRHYFETVTCDQESRRELAASLIALAAVWLIVLALGATKSAGWW